MLLLPWPWLVCLSLSLNWTEWDLWIGDGRLLTTDYWVSTGLTSNYRIPCEVLKYPTQKQYTCISIETPINLVNLLLLLLQMVFFEISSSLSITRLLLTICWCHHHSYNIFLTKSLKLWLFFSGLAQNPAKMPKAAGLIKLPVVNPLRLSLHFTSIMMSCQVIVEIIIRIIRFIILIHWSVNYR